MVRPTSHDLTLNLVLFKTQVIAIYNIGIRPKSRSSLLSSRPRSRPRSRSLSLR